MLYSTDDLTLRALRHEQDRLSKLAAKAAAEVDEYIGTGQEAVAIYNELAAIDHCKKSARANLKQLDVLRKRQARIERIRKKDIIALMDRQHEAEWERDLAAQAISDLEFRSSFRRSH